jgi:cytochrome c oxidase assembly protein subunit 15
MKPPPPLSDETRSIAFWLWLVCTLIILMVAVGGITRLTGSGLSIADWNPIMGAIPPRNEAQWQAAFDLYKSRATTQYEQFSRNLGEMKLSDFQEIYFWEYIHRLLGRLIGLAYAIPMAVFWIRGRVRGSLRWKLLLGLLLGGGQGFLGWFMVTSGFAELPRVSHFRLAAHLSMALLLFSYLLWIVLDLHPFWTHRKTNYHSVARLRKLSIGFLGILSLQIVYGAFTAGLRGGHMHNTYPLMGGRLFPDTQWNPLTDPASVQFVHRHLGLLVLAALIALWVFAQYHRLMDRQKLAFNLLFFFGVLQFVLGLHTLMSGVQIHTAVAHQVTACLLLGSAVLAVHELIDPAPRAARSRV